MNALRFICDRGSSASSRLGLRALPKLLSSRLALVACTMPLLLSSASCDRAAVGEDQETSAAQEVVATATANVATTADQAADKNAPLPVAVVTLEGRTVVRVPRTLTGVLEAKRTSELGFKRIGRIEELSADEGDTIEAGQTLATIDTASLERELAGIVAQRTAAQAKLDELVAGPRAQTIDAARAQLDELTAVRNQLQSTFERRRSLANTDAVSRQDIDDARHQLAAAEAKVTAQRQVVAELEEGTRAEQIAAQRAECERLDASVASIQVLIDESTLAAPYRAIISRRFADEGSITAPGQALFRVVEVAPLEARIGVPLELIQEVLAKEKHEVVVDAKPREARLKAVLPELDMMTRTRTVVLELLPQPAAENAAGKLGIPEVFRTDAAGQIVHLKVTQPVSQSGFWLPMSALVRGVKGLWSVFVVEESVGSDVEPPQYYVRRNDVEIVQIDSERVLVAGTIQSGDKVVTGGVQKLVVGQRVVLADLDRQPPQTE